jgi:DNA-binding transcriptional regulator YiaG
VRPSERQLVEIARIRDDLASGRAREQRRAAGVSLAEVARVLKVSRQAVGYWETGHARPGGENALAYGRLLARLTEKAA